MTVADCFQPDDKAPRGLALLRDPLLNQGDGFAEADLDGLGLRGLVPPGAMSLDRQAVREMERLRGLSDALDKFIHLAALQDRDEALYYRLLIDNVIELTPIVYTPTVGAACQRYSHIYQRPRGMFFSARDRGRFRAMMDNWPEDEIDIVVVTDGSRVLGLGDQGAGGMGISVGKVALYVAGGGIHPRRTLAAMIDVGTGHQEKLADPMYIGLRQERLGGEAYDAIVDEFVRAAHDRWPMALIQFEDFTNDHAFSLLARYRDEIPSFNDDIQGTGGMALAGILAALRITGERLTDQRIVFLGAGSAGIGIADMIVAGMQAESGISAAAARRRFWFLDSKGLVTHARGGRLAAHKVPYARTERHLATLTEVVADVKPTVLMGLSGQHGAFTREVLGTMRAGVERPIIFALSNPTSKAECTARQAYERTDGAAIFASGSPFDAVELNGRTHVPGQGNNMFIFPGVGLGATLCGARCVTDAMFSVAAKSLAAEVTAEDLAAGTVYPDLRRIRTISASIAEAVCRLAYEEGLATVPEPADLGAFVAAAQYQPKRPVRARS